LTSIGDEQSTAALSFFSDFKLFQPRIAASLAPDAFSRICCVQSVVNRGSQSGADTSIDASENRSQRDGGGCDQKNTHLSSFFLFSVPKSKRQTIVRCQAVQAARHVRQGLPRPRRQRRLEAVHGHPQGEFLMMLLFSSVDANDDCFLFFLVAFSSRFLAWSIF